MQITKISPSLLNWQWRFRTDAC